MKTQLLQDFDESGSKAADEAARAAQEGGVRGPDAAQPPPRAYASPPAAVWHRPQAPVTPTQRSTADTTARQGPQLGAQMRPPGGHAAEDTAPQDWTPPAQSRQRAAEGAWTGPRPLPPEARTAAAAMDATARRPAHEQAAGAMPPPMASAPDTDIPDWLSERLREDAEQDAQRQRSRLMARRALGWSAAATVVAMLAVAGYWFYQESRVEGALNVVANTSPAPAAVVATPEAKQRTAMPATAAPAAPLVPNDPVATAAPAAATVTPAPEPMPEQIRPEPAKPKLARVSAAQEKAERAPHRRKQHSPAATRVRAAADTVDADADSGPTPAQRREETLMQCRVLGYDERECTRRGCMMTRFGLACPG